MSLQAIRALFETELNSAYQAMTPPVPVVFDNVQEEPPGTEYVIMSLSYPSFAEPQLCPDESLIEYIRGNIQLACYTPRAQGMGRLESMATVGMQALFGIGSSTLAENLNPKVGQLLGPLPVLSGDAPYALMNMSAPFTVRVTLAASPLTVDSLHGRTGDVVAVEGDYDLKEMGDVGPASAPGEFMKWNGSEWVSTPSLDSEDF